MQAIHARSLEKKFRYTPNVLSGFRPDQLTEQLVGYMPVVGSVRNMSDTLIAGMEWDLCVTHLQREIFVLVFRDEFVLQGLDDKHNESVVLEAVVNGSVDAFLRHCLGRMHESGVEMEVPEILAKERRVAIESLREMIWQIR